MKQLFVIKKSDYEGVTELKLLNRKHLVPRYDRN